MRTLSAFSAALVGALLCVMAPAWADEPLPPHVTVSGQGVVSAVPDLATLSIGVRSENDAAAAALSDNSARMRTLLAAVDAAGVPKADVQTAVVTLEPRMVYPDGGQPRITGYVARNVVTVRVRDLAKLGTLLGGAVAAGSNDLSGLSYDFADRTQLADRARTAAVTDARRKAEGIAAAAAVKLGRVLRIAEEDQRGGGPMPRAMLADAKADVPVESGMQDVAAAVSVTWEIVP